MVKLFSLIIGMVCVLSGFAQETGTVKGIIKDGESKETLIGVNIILPSGTGTITDPFGEYEVKLPAGTHEITFRFVGYDQVKKKVTVTAGKTTTLNLNLKQTATQLNMVVVSASKFEQKIEDVAVSMEVLQPELVENKNTTSIESALDQVPGCTVQDGQISIRGGSGFAYGAGSRVLLVVDGLPLLAGDAGDAKWNTLPLENIQQVEVMKGASSVLFGSSALNGVINLRTGYPTDEPKTKVTLFHGIYDSPLRRDSTGSATGANGQPNRTTKWWQGTQSYNGANFLHSRKFGKQLDFTLSGAYFEDNGYREGEWERRGRMNVQTRYRSEKVKGLSYGIDASHQDSEGGLYILWMDADSGALRPSGGLDPETTTISDYRSLRTNVDPYLEYWNKKGNKHTFKNRWYRTENRNNTNQSSVATLLYSEYQYVKMFNDSTTLTSGLVIQSNFVNAELYGDHDGNNFAAFTQFDKKLTRATFSAGVRAEYARIDTFKSVSSFTIGGGNRLPVQPVFRAGSTYRLAKATTLRASYGQGFRFPSIAEKFVTTQVGPLLIFANPDLEPETGWSGEIGIKQGVKIGNWLGYVDAAAFIQEYKNMMEFTFGVYLPEGVDFSFDPADEGYVLNWAGFRATNVENSRITGLDFSLVGKGEIVRGWDMTVLAGYTYMNPITRNADSAYLATFSNPESNLLKYRYRHLIKGDFQFDHNRWSFGISGRYNSFMENIDQAFVNLEIPTPGQSLFLGDVILPGIEGYRNRNDRGDLVFDGRMSYQITESAKLNFIVNNLFNREYTSRPGDIQPPRTFVGQVNVVF